MCYNRYTDTSCHFIWETLLNGAKTFFWLLTFGRVRRIERNCKLVVENFRKWDFKCQLLQKSENSSRDGILPNVAHSGKSNLPFWPVYGRGRVNIIYILVPKATGSLMDGSASIVQYVSSLSHSQLHFVCPIGCPPLRNGRRGLVPIKRNGRRTTRGRSRKQGSSVSFSSKMTRPNFPFGSQILARSYNFPMSFFLSFSSWSKFIFVCYV